MSYIDGEAVYELRSKLHFVHVMDFINGNYYFEVSFSQHLKSSKCLKFSALFKRGKRFNQ